MGNKISLVPKYFRDFNLMNRASKEISLDKIKISPRHPTTAELLKKNEEQAPNFDERDLNKKVIESHVNVVGGGGVISKEIHDRRPKKENEEIFMRTAKHDIDYEKYGYSKPDKIKPGNLTLRSFDELINEFKQAKSEATSNNEIELIHVNLTKKFNVDKEDLKLLIEYYKPFYVIESKNKKEEVPVQSFFPNLNKIVSIDDKAGTKSS